MKFVSTINGKDCKISRSLDGKDMCQADAPKITVTESKYKASSTSDIEGKYK